MNNSMKKLFISILSFTFALILFGTVSYAWFSVSTTNVIYDIGLGITTDNKFQISLDGINYYNSLSNEDIMNVVGNNLELLDVTSHDGKIFTKGFPEKNEVAEKNIDYLSITLYFRTTDFEKNVYLVEDVSRQAYLDKDIDGTYVISKGINWKADITFQYSEDAIIELGERHMLYAAEAVRIGFVEQKIETNLNDKRNDDDLNTKIFDLSRDPSRGYGTGYGSLDYLNVKHGKVYELPTTVQNVTSELSVYEEFSSYQPLDDNSYLLRMIETNRKDHLGDTYHEGKVQLNIWLEGWDADCFNAILRDQLTIQLKFKGSRDI